VIRVFPDPETLSRAGAEVFLSRAGSAIRERGRFSVALSGGSTPRRLYRLLTLPEFSAQIPWSGIDLFWGDERAVSPEDGESNFGMARQELLSKIDIPAGNIHRMQGELDPEEGAREYAKELNRYFSETGSSGLDLVLLGLGNDGHTASLFPRSASLAEEDRLVVPAISPQGIRWRLTMTLPLLNRSSVVLFLVSGKKKREPLNEVFQPGSVAEIPARGVRPLSGEIYWYVDHDAAGEKG